MPRRGVLDLLASTALLIGCGSASQEDAGGGSAGEGGTGGDASSGGSGGSGGLGGGGAGGQPLSCKDDGPPSACRLTEDNILGPFYKKGAPLADDLAGELPGQVLIIEGTVFGCDCETPLANALVDIWQADDEGAYDNAGFTLRGKVLTDAEGRYTVRTIKPGWYLNGDQYRPAHIHYKVSHPDGVALTTQLYFEGDPYIEIDPYVKESLVKAIVPDRSIGRVSFDIALG